MNKVKITINGVELPSDQFVISEGLFDNKLNGVTKIAINTPEMNDEQSDRLHHQLEALSWLQGKTSNEFVLGWIAMHKESLERAGGTPERN